MNYYYGFIGIGMTAIFHTIVTTRLRMTFTMFLHFTTMVSPFWEGLGDGIHDMITDTVHLLKACHVIYYIHCHSSGTSLSCL